MIYNNRLFFSIVFFSITFSLLCVGKGASDTQYSAVEGQTDSQEVDSQELDGQELDGQELDGQELDGQELDSQEVDDQEVDDQEVDSQDNQDSAVSYNSGINDGYEENIDFLEVPSVDLKEFIAGIFEFLQNIISKESEASRAELNLFVMQKVAELIESNKKVIKRTVSPTAIPVNEDQQTQEMLKSLANVVNGFFNIASIAANTNKSQSDIGAVANQVAFMVNNIVNLSILTKQ